MNHESKRTVPFDSERFVGMDWFVVNVSICRSNPLVMRVVRVPAHYSVKDFVALCCVVLGREVTEGKLYSQSSTVMDAERPVSGGSEVVANGWPSSGDCEVKDSGRLLSDLFDKEGEYSVVFKEPGSGSMKTGGSVNLYVFVEDVVSEGKIDKNNAVSKGKINAETVSEGKPLAEGGLPVVVSAVGRNMPSDLYDIAEFNRIQLIFEQEDYCDMGNGRVYSGRELGYSERKTVNAIKKHFAPGTEERELNMKLGMPMELLFEKSKVSDLKEIAGLNGIYYDSQMRKQGLVNALCRKLGGDSIVKLFENMGAEEFADFKRLVFCEDPDGEQDDWEDILPTLYNAGLVMDVPKLGYRVASEVLDYYDSFCGTDKEIAFVRKKYMRSAMLAAGRLYGVFEKKWFLSILEKLSPEKIPEKASDEYFTETTRAFYMGEYDSFKEGTAYYKKALGLREAEEINKERFPDRSVFYEPSGQEIMGLLRNGVCFSRTAEEKLGKFISEYSYSYWGYGYNYSYDDGASSSCGRIAAELQKKGDVDAALRVAENEMRRLSWSDKKESVIAKVREILEKESGTIPLMSLNGFSRKNCPKELLEHEEKVREEKANKTRTKRQAAVQEVKKMATKKLEAKKAAAVKKVAKPAAKKYK